MNRLEQRAAPRMNVARRRDAQTSADRRPQIGQDVPKQVRGHDDIKALRRADKLHRGDIDEQMTRLDLAMLGGHHTERPLPQSVGVRQGVGFVNHTDSRRRMRGAVRHLGQQVGRPNDSLDTPTGIEVFTDRYLVGRIALERAAHLHIRPLGVLTQDPKVHIAPRLPLDRTEPLVEKLHWPQVDIQIEPEAQPQQHIARHRSAWDRTGS